MPNQYVEAVNVLNLRLMKLKLSPDWKWSNDIKPIIGNHGFQATNSEILVEGAVHCVCNDGSEATYTGWRCKCDFTRLWHASVAGDTPAVVYELAGMWGEFNTW